MSVIAMTSARLARERRGGAREPEQRFGPSLRSSGEGPAVRREDVLTQLIRYTPTEVVGLYVAAVSILPAIPRGDQEAKAIWQYDFSIRWFVFFFFFVGASVAVYSSYRLQARISHQAPSMPVFEMIVAPIAFAAWALALPLAPPSSWKSWHPWGGALIAILVLFAVGEAAKITGKSLTYDSRRT